MGVEEIQKATRSQAPGGADLRPYLGGWAEYFGKGARNPRILHALAVAGTEPTSNFSGNILNLLAARPELWQQLRTDRTLVETVVAEG